MKRIAFYVFFLGISLSLYAQKIKYKDIFPLLESRSYETVESQLRDFLANEKNHDEANAHFQMGVLLEKYYRECDPVRDSLRTFAYADSAMSEYHLAFSLIDDKELRKNDQYYQSFYRRDLRTGEFGIKLSDVQLEIENKIESIQARNASIRTLFQLFESLEKSESSMVKAFNSLLSTATSFLDFALKASVDDISAIGTLINFHENTETTHVEIKKLLIEIGITEGYESIKWRNVPAFGEIAEILHPYEGQLEAWDMKTWGNEAKNLINGDIDKLKSEYTFYDDDLSRAEEKLKNGTVAAFYTSLHTEVVNLTNQYDPDNAIFRLISLRMMELTVRALSDTLFNPGWSDSLQIAQHVMTCDSVMHQLDQMNPLIRTLPEQLPSASRYYQKFLSDRYQGLDNAISYVKSLEGWQQQQVIKWDSTRAFWHLRNDWGLTKKDTIPLNKPDSTYTGKFFTLGNLTEGPSDIICYGVKKDSTKGFVARFGADRKVLWQLRFESPLLKDRQAYLFEIDTLAGGQGNRILYFYDPVKAEGDNLTLLSFSNSGKINWCSSTHVEKKPVFSTYTETIGQLTLYLHPQDAYPLTDGSLGYIIVDRNGKIN